MLVATAVAIVLAAPRDADAQTTFCGGGAYGTRAESVWQALKNYEAVLSKMGTTKDGRPVYMERNCLWCHSSEGALNNHYVHTAFEMDILGDWMKSSYFVPGRTKAHSAWRRIGLKVMPPGKWTTAEPELTALQNKISAWTASFYSCGASFECIWGADVTAPSGPAGDLQRCNW